MRDDWQARMLGEVAHVSAGNSAPQNKALFANGTHPFFRTADAGRLRFGDIYEANDYLNDDGIKGLRRYPKGTILFPKSGASTFLNHRVMLGVEGYVSSHLATIVTDRAQAEPRYLMYFLSTISAQDLVQDHAYPSLNLPAISGITIQVPPLPEQQRIVALLDEAFAGLATAKANAERNLQNARAIFESHLQSVFSQRGDGWVEKQLRDFCAFENGDRGSNYPSKKARSATGIPFINAGHLTDDGIDLAKMDYIPRERFDLLSNGKIRAGDILFCLRGSLGKFASVGDLDEGAIASSLVIVRPDKTVLNDYLIAYFRSSLCASMINDFKNGTAQPNLAARSLGDFIAPFHHLPTRSWLSRSSPTFAKKPNASPASTNANSPPWRN